MWCWVEGGWAHPQHASPSPCQCPGAAERYSSSRKGNGCQSGAGWDLHGPFTTHPQFPSLASNIPFPPPPAPTQQALLEDTSVGTTGALVTHGTGSQMPNRKEIGISLIAARPLVHTAQARSQGSEFRDRLWGPETQLSDSDLQRCSQVAFLQAGAWSGTPHPSAMHMTWGCPPCPYTSNPPGRTRREGKANDRNKIWNFLGIL